MCDHCSKVLGQKGYWGQVTCKCESDEKRGDKRESVKQDKQDFGRCCGKKPKEASGGCCQSSCCGGDAGNSKKKNRNASKENENKSASGKGAPASPK